MRGAIFLAQNAPETIWLSLYLDLRCGPGEVRKMGNKGRKGTANKRE